MGRFRLALGVRGVLLVGVGSWLGLVLLQQPGATGVGLLVGLLLILADFHGDPVRRLRAYTVTTAVGAVFVAGAVAITSLSPPVLVGCVVVLSGLLALIRSGGGMFAAAGTALVADLLVGVAAGMRGANPAELAAAAFIGGATATALAFLIRPAPWVSPVRTASAALLQQCAEVLDGTRAPADLRDSSRALLAVYIDRPERPATPTPSAIASLNLLSELTFLADLLAESSAPPRAAAATLAAARRGLLEPRSRPCRQQLLNALTDLEHTTIQQDFHSLAIREACWAIGVRTLAILPKSEDLPGQGGGDFMAEVRIRLSPGSTVLWSGLASGLLFGILVFVALRFEIAHPQWVLLVAVSTFYPYARRAASKAGVIIAGTLLGLLVLAGLAWLLGSSSPWWWLVLLVAAGTSMSAPHTNRGTVLGQGAFTLLSLTLLGLASQGVGVHAVGERAIDIVVGAGIAVVTVLVIAPRGLHGRLRNAISGLLDTAANAIAEAPAEAKAGGLMTGDASGAVARGQFLRCVDIVDVMHGSATVDPERLLDWLSAARLAGQACVTSAICASSGGPPAGSSAGWRRTQQLYFEQARALRTPGIDAEPWPGSPPDTVVEPWAGAEMWLVHNARRQARLLASLRSDSADPRASATTPTGR